MNEEGLTETQQKRALDTYLHLELLTFLGRLDERLLGGRVLDWGAFTGTNSVALKRFGGYVEAVDISDAVSEIAKRGILPKEQTYQTDGINFLRERPNTYDLVAAFLFGPITNERDRQFLRQFYDAARIGVKPEGRILMTSDIASFRFIEELARTFNGDVLKYPTFPNAYLGRKYVCRQSLARRLEYA